MTSHLNGTLQVNHSHLVHPWNQKKTASLNENFLLLLTDSESPSAVWQERLIDQIFFIFVLFSVQPGTGNFPPDNACFSLKSLHRLRAVCSAGGGLKAKEASHSPHLTHWFSHLLNARFSPEDFADTVSASIQLKAVWRLSVSGAGSATRFKISALFFE